MGNELACVLRCDGGTFSGKALLETSELLFRGDTRLKIPFASIKTVHAKNGELFVRTSGRLAVFELGPQAEKWRERIVNPKSLIEKLGVKPGDAVRLEGNFPADFLASLAQRGARPTKKQGSARWIFLAAESVQDLRRVSGIAQSMEGAAAIWIVYPKGQKSITESHVRSAGLKSRLTDTKVASFSSTHTALKFVVPKSKR